MAIARSALGLQPLRGAWERLYRAGRYSIFQSPEWNLLAARVFARREAMVIHARSDSGEAIIPACFSDGKISFLGDVLFDYRDVLAEGDEEVLRRAWQQLAKAQRPLSITALAGEDARRTWEERGFAPAPFCHAPAVHRAAISADVFAGRHERAARALRKLVRAGVQFATHRGDELPLVRHIYEAKARQPITGNLFAEDPARREFMIAAATGDPRCEIFTLETAGALVAALLTFRDGDVRRYYTTYYERAWAHYSPGVALMFEATRRSLQEGLDCDFMTGEQPHKTRFATCGVPLYKVEAQAEELAHLSRASTASAGERAPLPSAA